jgi:hypothetical protein
MLQDSCGLNNFRGIHPYLLPDIFTNEIFNYEMNLSILSIAYEKLIILVFIKMIRNFFTTGFVKILVPMDTHKGGGRIWLSF